MKIPSIQIYGVVLLTYIEADEGITEFWTLKQSGKQTFTWKDS